MASQRLGKVQGVVVGVMVVLIGAGIACYFAIPSFREVVNQAWEAKAAAAEAPAKTPPAILIYESKTAGLRLTSEAIEGHGIRPVKAKNAREPRALPPQCGTVNYDNDRLFSIRSRFQGEVVEIDQCKEPGTSGKWIERPLRYGDRVKQGQLLAIVYSRDLGEKKAALVDAVCSLRLSEDSLTRHKQMYGEGALALASLKASERQVQLDSNAVLTAERTLLMWKLSAEEITDIKKEAEFIHDQKLSRSADIEAKKWGRVEIRAPKIPDSPNQELVVVEKNTNLGDMADPGNSTPLFRLADMTRLQIWAHPPEEYLPAFRKMLDSPASGPAGWKIQFLANPKEKVDLQFVQIAPSYEPNQHTPMLIGYLPNPDGTRYVVGQYVTATIMLPPDRDTVEIPTEALNEVGNQAFVFVQHPTKKDEFYLRRVAVVQRFAEKTFVRSVLTPEDKEKAAQDKGQWPVEELHDGECVVTQGVVELTACLEELRTKESSK